jgi:hypothetical protein
MNTVVWLDVDELPLFDCAERLNIYQGAANLIFWCKIFEYVSEMASSVPDR